MSEKIKKKQKDTTTDTDKEDVPYVVEITPGVGGKQNSLTAVLPGHMRNSSVDEIVDYFLNTVEWEDAIESDIANMINREISGDDYEITIGDNVIDGSNNIGDYFEDAKSKSGKDFKKTSLRIASTKRGGYYF